jgi:hypothetical protein
MSEEYYRFLVRTITTVGQDHAQLRRIIYHYARTKLRKELYGKKDLQWAQIKQQMAAFEKAIEQIESDVADHTMFFPISSPAGAAIPAGTATQSALTKSNNALVVREDFAVLERTLEQIDPDVYDSHAAIVGTRLDPIRTFKPVRAVFRSATRLVLAVILGVTLFAALANRGDLRSPRNDVANGTGPIAGGHASQAALRVTTSSPPAALAVKAIESNPSFGLQAANIPVPNAYGVYAVSHGKLTDLQTLPIRVPDERVGISAIFSTPSESTLPDGHLQFIAFRRDLANSAPDRVMVRVVARVMRALTFDAAGHAKLVDVESSWAVRSNKYEMQVAPVNGNPEMILIRPQNSSFTVPAGRYALVLQGSAYDFTVAGTITNTAQCLERTDALNMPVYTECHNL